MSMNEIFNMGSKTKGMDTLKGLIVSGKSEIDLARRKGYGASLIQETRSKALTRISDHVLKMKQEQEKRINDSKEKNKTQYESFVENDPGRPAAVERLKIKYNSMSDSELQAAAGMYQAGQSKLYDSAEIEILAGLVKKINKPSFEMMRKKMLENNYEQPYLQLLTEEEKKSEQILKEGGLPLVMDRGDGRDLEIIGMSTAQILKMAEI